MSQRKKWRHSGERFVALGFEMVESEAWRSLSCEATWLYIELKHRFNGKNNGNIILPYSQVKFKLKSPATINKKFNELIRVGFVNKKDNVGGGLFRNPNRYELSERWKGYCKSNLSAPPTL